MKRYIYLFAMLMCMQNAPGNPSFTIGSNPYLTIFAYPHDILRWPASGVYFNYQNQELPWQGNVTDISARPSESYTNNYQFVEFATPDDYAGDPSGIYSWSMISGYAHQRYFGLGSITSTPYGKFMGEMGISTLNMLMEAEGVARSEEEGEVFHLVPFRSQTKGAQFKYEGKILYARQLYNNPFGFKVDYVYKHSLKPNGYLNFMIDSTQYETNHLTWGWANQSCNHIFGYPHINTDAFFQNEYSVINGSQLDLQASYDFNGNYKTGIRYRLINESGDDYNWQYDEGSLYTGNYSRNPDWMKKNVEQFFRAYSKVRFFELGNLGAGILFFGQYGKNDRFDVNRLSESEPNSQEIVHNYIVETNPFLNFKFEKGYIDFGLLLEEEYSPLKNIHTAWNESTGGEEQNVLWDSSPYEGWSTSWESFSKGHELFFATGGETYTSINIYKRFSMQGGLTLLRKYTNLKKVYGNSNVPDGGGNFEFTKTHIRKDHRNETWMTGSLGLTYGFGPIQLISILQFPLSYLNKRETVLSDIHDDILFEHERRNVWQVQQPASFRLILVCALSKPEGH
jgi:hypothetical protein